MSTIEDIVAAAMELSSGDRAQIANRLLESLDAEDGDEFAFDEEYEQELLNRLDAYDRGEVKALDWNDVKEQLQESLRQNKRT
jgi:putative addiction module component (TIGR02574 family)